MNEMSTFEIISRVAHMFILLVAWKAIAIGSEFDFILWFKYKKKYTNWYNNREKFDSTKIIDKE